MADRPVFRKQKPSEQDKPARPKPLLREPKAQNGGTKNRGLGLRRLKVINRYKL